MEGDAFSSPDRPEVSAHPWRSQKLAASQMRSNWLQYRQKESICVAVCCNDLRLLGAAQVLRDRDQWRKECLSPPSKLRAAGLVEE